MNFKVGDRVIIIDQLWYLCSGVVDSTESNDFVVTFKLCKVRLLDYAKEPTNILLYFPEEMLLIDTEINRLLYL